MTQMHLDANAITSVTHVPQTDYAYQTPDLENSSDPEMRRLAERVDALLGSWPGGSDSDPFVQQAVANARELLAKLPPVDTPLLRKGVEWVETQAALPGNGAWNQYGWVSDYTNTSEEAKRGCGTAYCFAGYIAQSNHPELTHVSGVELTVDGQPRWLSSSVASDLALGITVQHEYLVHAITGNSLYAAMNTPEIIRLVCETLAGEKL